MREAVHVTSDIIKRTQNMKLEAPIPLEKFLFDAEDPCCTAALGKLQCVKARSVERPAKNQTWRTKTKQACDDIGVRYSSLRAPPEVAASPWFSSLTLREQQGLAVACEKARLTGAEMTSLDTTPCVRRMCGAKGAVLHTLVPEARVCLFAPLVSEFRVMTGMEAMRITGFGDDVLRSFLASNVVPVDVDRLFFDMAGNAFSGNVILAITISILISLTTQHKRDGDGCDFSDWVGGSGSESDDPAAALLPAE